jgi:hypothetical protein
MFNKLTQFMEKSIRKNKEMPVVKPIKGNFINTNPQGILEDKKGNPIPVLHVVNQDDEVVATFGFTDHGPRYYFKAHQYAFNASTPSEALRVKELDK